MLIGCLAGCGNAQLDPVSFEIDAKESKYKHINNGGIEDASGLPYNIDAITGATLTVEGPAVEASVPLSVREIENRPGTYEHRVQYHNIDDNSREEIIQFIFEEERKSRSKR